MIRFQGKWVLGGALVAVGLISVIAGSTDPRQPPNGFPTADRTVLPTTDDRASQRVRMTEGAVEVWKDEYGSGVGVSMGFGPEAGHDALLLPPRNEIVNLIKRSAAIRAGEVWQSNVVNTADFARIGLKVAASGPVTCWAEWQWDADEPFLADAPQVMLQNDGAPRMAFGEVLGLRAMIVCRGADVANLELQELKILLRR